MKKQAERERPQPIVEQAQPRLIENEQETPGEDKKEDNQEIVQQANQNIFQVVKINERNGRMEHSQGVSSSNASSMMILASDSSCDNPSHQNQSSFADNSIEDRSMRVESSNQSSSQQVDLNVKEDPKSPSQGAGSWDFEPIANNRPSQADQIAKAYEGINGAAPPQNPPNRANPHQQQQPDMKGCPFAMAFMKPSSVGQAQIVKKAPERVAAAAAFELSNKEAVSEEDSAQTFYDKLGGAKTMAMFVEDFMEGIMGDPELACHHK